MGFIIIKNLPLTPSPSLVRSMHSSTINEVIAINSNALLITDAIVQVGDF